SKVLKPTQSKKRKVAKGGTVTATAEEQKLKKVRGRRGLLSSLKEFPLDVLFEIFGHLHPVDLLHLARTTKEIRGIISHSHRRFSSSFFRVTDSHSILGLPDLPPDLCEPQYANLAFDGHCHNCFATPVQTVIWSARTRMCKKCIQDNFVAGEYVASVTGLDRTLLSLVPSLNADIPTGRRSRWRQLFYSIDLATKLRKKCEDFMVDSVLQHRDPGFMEWRQHKAEEVAELNDHAQLCATWAANRSNDRINELDEARRLRREAIVQRLTALGWGDEIPLHGHEFDCHKLVKQPRQLTDRIWKNIESSLVELLTGLKKERLEQERRNIVKERRLLAVQVYHKYRDTFPSDVLFPPKVDMIRTEPFRAVIEDTPVHPEEKVTEESFAAALLHVPQFSDDWRRSKDKELLQIMKKTSPQSVEADLQLASTFFACSDYGTSEPIGYPRILFTAAPTVLSYRHDGWDGEGDQPLRDCLREEAWNDASVIRFNNTASRIVRSVLLACGLDPDVTTTSELDEIDPVMECLNCNHDVQGRFVMRWIQTVRLAKSSPFRLDPRYFQTTHHCGLRATWKCLTRDEELLAEVKEKEFFDKTNFEYTNWQAIFCCKLCDQPKAKFLSMKEHLKTACVIIFSRM
ncbi:hypothetical protein DFH09DRAFT_1451602, partial [Mycena vulgaris]